MRPPARRSSWCCRDALGSRQIGFQMWTLLLQLSCPLVFADLENRSPVLGLHPVPQAALPQLPRPLIFSPEPLLGTPNPIRVNLIQQGIIPLDDFVLPQIPESREVL